MSMVPRAILSNFVEEQWTQNHPQYLSGLSRALLATTFLKIAVYGRKTSHEGPFKTSRAVVKRRELGISPGYSKHGPGYLQRKIQCRRKAWIVVSGLHNCQEFSQPLECLYQAMQTQEKRFLLLLWSNFPEIKEKLLGYWLKEKFLPVAKSCTRSLMYV